MNKKWQYEIATLDDEIDSFDLTSEKAKELAESYLADPEGCKAWRPASPARIKTALAELEKESSPSQTTKKSKKYKEEAVEIESVQEENHN
jgi:hypothetical protein